MSERVISLFRFLTYFLLNEETRRDARLPAE